jgi:hypothetical protein
MEDLEPVYDAEIAPLMTRIIEICKQHDLPMFCSFQLSDGDPEAHEAGREPLFCTTYILPDGCSVAFHKAVRVIRDGWEVHSGMVAITITSGKAGE